VGVIGWSWRGLQDSLLAGNRVEGRRVSHM
jgi:hypothetical protein